MRFRSVPAKVLANVVFKEGDRLLRRKQMQMLEKSPHFSLETALFFVKND